MGAKTDLFPTFSELCTAAREVEKMPLSIPPRPIDGKLMLDENLVIFPREFEEYTYSFLLFEAQKIERRLSTDAIASTRQESILNQRRLTPEQQMQIDLHKFVSTQEQVSLDEEENRLLVPLREKDTFVSPTPLEVAEYERDHVVSFESSEGDLREGAPLLPKKAAPLPAPVNENEEFPSPPRAKPLAQPPTMSVPAEQNSYSPLPVAPKIPLAPPSTQIAPQTPPAKSGAAVPKLPVSMQSEQDLFEPVPPQSSPQKEPEQPVVSGAEKQQPPVKLSYYSKLSPRLQALMEQKLRREEERAKKASGDSDIFKTPLPKPRKEEPSSDKQLEDIDAPNAWNVRDEEGAGMSRVRDKGEITPPPVSKEDGRETLTPVFQSEIEREENPREPLPSKMENEEQGTEEEEMPSPGEDEQFQQETLATNQPKRKEKIEPATNAMSADAPQEEDENSLPEVPEEKEAQSSRLQSPTQAESVMIKPLFPDTSVSESQMKEKQAISQSEDSDRMRRIQRIIEDLSPDKMRGSLKQKDTSSKEKELEPLVVLPRKPSFSLPAREMENKVQGAEEESQVAVLQPGSPAKADETPLPKKPVPLMPVRGGKSKGLAEETRAPAKIKQRPSVRDEESEEVEMKEPVPQKASQEKKSKAQSVPLKKLTNAQKKKAAAALETEVPKEKQKAASVKKLRGVVQISELPEDETGEIVGEKKAVPDDVMRQRETSAAKKKEPTLPVKKPQTTFSSSEPRFSTSKIVPLPPEHEEENKEAEEQAPAATFRKPLRQIPVPEDDGESKEAEEQAPAATFRKPLSRISTPAREEDEEAPVVPVSSMRRRILPGLARTVPSTPQTYVPPARDRKQIPLPSKEPDEEAMQTEEQVKIPLAAASLKPRTIAMDETSTAIDKSPGQVFQEQKMAKMAEQLARLEAGKVKEVSGTAALPLEEEDIPLPDENADVPKPQEYEQAKENLRKTIERDEIARKVKQEDEVMVEQYAKDHLVWLYEIYKMGGMSREDFLQKASEKYSEAQNASPVPETDVDKDAPPNPALANLGKEIEKKDKK